MSSYPRGKEPRCPVCGVNPIKDRASLQCADCRRGVPVPSRTDPNILNPHGSFDSAWAGWMKAVGMARDRYQGPHLPHLPNGGKSGSSSKPKKILVVPDPHAPFIEQEMFAEMLEREKDADLAVCIGDLSDSYSLSTFTHYQPVSFGEEWASVTLTLQALSERFSRVKLIIGNHDARLEKRLRERLDQNMLDAVKYLSGGVLCPITALAKRYPNVEVAKHTVATGDSIDWFTTVGDAWLGHPEKYSRTPGAALRFVDDWLSDREYDLGLDRYRLIVMGHTHQQGAFPWRGRQLLVEAGCLCQTQGYMLKPKIGGRPQMRGYLTFEQTNGVTDLNSVRFYNFDFARQGAVA